MSEKYGISFKPEDKVRFVSIKFENGSWRVNFVINNERKSKSFATRDGAQSFQEFLDEFVVGKRITVYSTGTQIELGKAFYEMMEYKHENNLIRGGTYCTYLHQFKSLFSSNEFGKTYISEIDAKFLRKIQNHLDEKAIRNGKDRATSMVNHAIIMLSQLRLFVAVHRPNWVNIPVTLELKKFKIKTLPKNITPYSLEEYQSILQKYKSLPDTDPMKRFVAIFILNMQLGLRVSELCGLSWSNIDFNTKKLNVVKAVSRTSDGSFRPGAVLKTMTSLRVLHINSFCISLLEDIKRLSGKNSLFVVEKLGGGNFTPSTITQIFRKTIKRLEIRYLPTHVSGRKTMATIMAQALTRDRNIDPFSAARKIQKRLGHKDIETTLAHYIVPATEDEDLDVDVFNPDYTKTST